MLRAPDGDAGLAASRRRRPRFASAHGYALAQLERVSSLTVAERADEFRRELAVACGARERADGYRLELLDRPHPRATSSTPTRPLRARMVLDVPAGGVTIDEERWDAARVRERESEALDGGTHACSSRRR